MAMCQPKVKFTSAQLKIRLNEVPMKDDDNPKVLANGIAQMRTQHCMNKIDEDKFLVAALAMAPKEYTSAIGMKQVTAEQRGEDFVTDNVFKAKLKHWKINEMKKRKKKRKSLVI